MPVPLFQALTMPVPLSQALLYLLCDPKSRSKFSVLVIVVAVIWLELPSRSCVLVMADDSNAGAHLQGLALDNNGRPSVWRLCLCFVCCGARLRWFWF
jgi:hypothetical protein